MLLLVLLLVFVVCYSVSAAAASFFGFVVVVLVDAHQQHYHMFKPAADECLVWSFLLFGSRHSRIRSFSPPVERDSLALRRPLNALKPILRMRQFPTRS